MNGWGWQIRTVVVLAAASGLSAASLSAVSLTRIAGDHLGFPAMLTWTLTCTADIGALAGAVLWTTQPPRSRQRRFGVFANLLCSIVSASAVGLDHVNHGSPDQGWPWVSFLAGTFMSGMATLLVHMVAEMLWAAPPMAAPVGQPEAAIGEGTAETTHNPAWIEPAPPPMAAPSATPTVAAQSTVKALVRAEWFRQAREALAEGRSLDTIVSAQVDVAAGAKPGYCKKHVKTWRAELESEVA